MRAALPLFLLLASPLAGAQASAPDAGVPPVLGRLLARHCSGCHDADSSLDLRTPPSASDESTWRDIREAVASTRMPQAAEDDDPRWAAGTSRPVPLGQGEREELVRAITAMLGARERPPPPRQRVELSQEEWLLVVREVARPFLKERELLGLLAPRRDYAGEGKSTLIAADVCERIVAVDLGRAAGERRMLGAVPGRGEGTLPDAAVEAVVRPMFSLVYQREPSAADVRDGQDRFRRFERAAASVPGATAALCTSYLSGVRLLQLRFDGSEP